MDVTTVCKNVWLDYKDSNNVGNQTCNVQGISSNEPSQSGLSTCSVIQAGLVSDLPLFKLI